MAASPAEQQLALQLDPADDDAPSQQCRIAVGPFVATVLDTDTTDVGTAAGIALCLIVAWCEAAPGGHALAEPTNPVIAMIVVTSVAATRRQKASPPRKLLALDPPIMARYPIGTKGLVLQGRGQCFDADQASLKAGREYRQPGDTSWSARLHE